MGSTHSTSTYKPRRSVAKHVNDRSVPSDPTHPSTRHTDARIAIVDLWKHQQFRGPYP